MNPFPSCGIGDLFFFVITIMARWNIKGLGRPEKQLAVRKLVKKRKLDLLLHETKGSKDFFFLNNNKGQRISSTLFQS